MSNSVPDPVERTFLGLTRKKRFRIYRWTALALVLGFGIWAWIYLQPSRWYKYTDQVAFEQSASDVKLGHVVWEPAKPSGGDEMREVSVSANGGRMVYSAGRDKGDANLFVRTWDGREWKNPKPMRALNSAFHESTPALSGDGKYLFFASDRPGGRGGSDIWVAKWDGVEYAWPLPLTGRVNSPFDETDPALSADSSRLYFASNRPYVSEAEVIMAENRPQEQEILADVRDLKNDYDLYAADVAGDTPFDVLVELQLSMLYSLREGALADKEVMEKLGGSRKTESAVDKGLGYLAKMQEEDGRWDIRKGGGQNGHDVASTAFALLAFYGRGERHDQECRYQENVRRGLKWLLDQQDRVTGDLRGKNPQHNAMYDQGIASLALIEAYGVTKDSDLRPRVMAAIEFMGDSQHEGGGWRYKPGERGDLSVTGWYIMAMASAKMSGIAVPDKTYDGAEKFLRYVSGGEHGGSYGYTDPPGRGNSNRHGMNAAGFFCSQLMGASPNGAQAYESARILSEVKDRESDLYYLYYATVAAYQNQGKLWREWREMMQKRFLKSQEKDGSWRARGGHSGSMGSIVGTAITVLCLEAHYRYTPLYGLGYEPDPAGPRPDALDLNDLPATPMFRHAKYLEGFNSDEDDRAPAVTDHGDFLYFASAREGGFGGSDIYRSRISGAAAVEVRNLGEEVNTAANESDPALLMEGFELIFNSDREKKDSGLFSAKSRRVVKKYDYAKLPGFGWIVRNIVWLLVFAGAVAGCFLLTKRAIQSQRNFNHE